MNKCTDVNGVAFTDKDIERWGEEADKGFPGWKFGKAVAGRPISVDTEKSDQRTA